MGGKTGSEKGFSVGRFDPGDELEQRRLAGAIRPDDPDNRAGRYAKRQLVDQQPVAVALGHALELDHLVAEALGHRNEYLLRFVALLVLVRREFLEARDPRLALRLPALGILAHPIELLLHRLDPRAFLLGLDLEPRFLLLQPGAVVALPRDAVATVELEDPLGGVVEEVPVVGDRDHRAGEARQELLEPVHALGVEVVGRLVQQQHVGLGQQQPAERDPAFLAARKHADHRVPGRQSQRVGGDFHLQVAVGARSREDCLVLRLLGRQPVEIGVGLGVRRVDLLQPGLRLEHFGQALLDRRLHRLCRVQVRLLRQEPDPHAGHRHRFAFELAVFAGHDLQQARLAGPVETQHADLGAGKKGQRDVLQDHALGRDDLADAIHRVNVLSHDHLPRDANEDRDYRSEGPRNAAPAASTATDAAGAPRAISAGYFRGASGAGAAGAAPAAATGAVRPAADSSRQRARSAS
jgi:hypothetical protein